MFEPLGISFGADQAEKINNALRLISHKENASHLRFWGKILTTKGDYYVIQGKSLKKHEPQVVGDMEKYNQGVNLYSYWVSNEILNEEWQ